jgi:hypothetical protein
LEKKQKAGLVVLIIGLVIIIIDLLSASSINWNMSMGGGLWFISFLFWLIIGIIPTIIGLVYLVRN